MIRLSILPFLLFIALSTFEGFAQSIGKVPGSLPVIRIDRSRGLTPNYIYDLDMDPKGQLLLATYGSGILVYNGNKFTSFLPDSISDFPVVRRVVSVGDEVVFVHHTGVWQYQPGWDYPKEVFRGDFMVYLIKKLGSDKLFISNNKESAVLEKDSTGIFREALRPFPFPVNDFLEVSDSLWLGIDYHGKVHLYHPHQPAQTRSLSLESPVERVFLVNGQLIFYSFEKLEVRDLSLKLIKEVQIPSNHRFFTFLVDGSKIWMAGPTGIFWFENNSIAEVETLAELAHSQIVKIFKTKDNTVWMGTNQEGLFKLIDQDIQRIQNKGESLGYVTNILPISGEKEASLIVTMNSLWKYSSNSLTQISLPEKPWFPNFEAAAITKDRHLLVGGRNVFFRGKLEGDKLEQVSIPGISPTQILKIVPLQNGDLLVGGLRGLYLLDGNLGLKKEYKSEQLAPSNIAQISYFSDDLILFGNSVDLFIWRNGVLSTYDPIQIEGKVISHYPFSDSKVWFGTSAGKAILYDLLQERVIKEVQSRLGKIVTTIGYAPDSTLMIATEIGPELFRKDGSVLVYDERVRSYEVPFNSYRFLENGDFLLGTINDLFLIKAGYKQKEKTKPYLVSLKVNAQQYAFVGEENIAPNSTLKTGVGGNDFLFSINQVDFLDGEVLQYSFRLFGLSDSWGPWQSDHSVQYTNVPFGKYTLGVRVRYSDRQILEFRFPYSFVVDAPFWLTPLGLILLFLLFWLVFYLLLTVFEKRNLQKNRNLTALINERNREVLEINKNLEEIVRTRTFDLEKKNIELIKTIKEKNIFQRNEQIISNNTHDIVCLVDTNFTINLISASMDQFIGISAEQATGRHLNQIFNSSGEIEKFTEYLSRLEEDEDADSALIFKLNQPKSNEELWIEIVGKKVYRQQGKELTGYVFNLRNVTERELLKEELNTVYKNIYRDFHDEVGNKLARIIALVSMAKLQLNEKYQIGDTIEKVEVTAKNLYRDTRDFIWSLDEANNNLEELSIQIRDFGEQLFDGSSISFKYFSSGLTSIPLKPNKVRDVLLIIKELMTNVLKHSQASECALLVRKQGSQLLFLVYDNGLGLSPEKFKKGRGLKNMLFRAERSHGQLIVKCKGKGTLVGVRIPLKFGLKQVSD